MSFFAALRVALGALLAHKGRSFLTSLGIVIGTGSVIALVAAGRYFTADELSQAAPVCVLGATACRELFPDDPAPVGRSVRVERLSLRVAGVLAPKGRNPAGADQDDEVFLPITTLQRKVAG